MTTDRFDIHHEQYLQEWIEANLRHLYEACADWIPWTDAEPTDSTSHGEDESSTTNQEHPSAA